MSRLPDLGPRGEGWVLIQLVLFLAVLVAGLVAGNAWGGLLADVTTIAGAGLMGAGLLLAAAGLRSLGPDLTPMPRPREGARLVRGGVYGMVRHPIYGGVFLMASGWGLLRASPLALAGASLLLVFLDVKARREEAWLRERFPDYGDYAVETRRLIPWLY